MNKSDYIKYWKTSALKDWRRVNLLFKNNDFIFALFCTHLCLEKLIKAHWIKDNESNHPPKIHNLVYLITKTKLHPNEMDLSFLEQMNLFQIEGRYPDYRKNLGRIYNTQKSKSIIANANKIKKWLIKNL